MICREHTQARERSVGVGVSVRAGGWGSGEPMQPVDAGLSGLPTLVVTKGSA